MLRVKKLNGTRTFPSRRGEKAVCVYGGIWGWGASPQLLSTGGERLLHERLAVEEEHIERKEAHLLRHGAIGFRVDGCDLGCRV